MDIETGEILDKRDTRNHDFTHASYDIKYNVKSEELCDTSEAYYDKAFSILDSVREELLSTNKLNKSKYKNYLQMILANIPRDYQRFYNDLSV